MEKELKRKGKGEKRIEDKAAETSSHSCCALILFIYLMLSFWPISHLLTWRRWASWPTMQFFRGESSKCFWGAVMLLSFLGLCETQITNTVYDPCVSSVLSRRQCTLQSTKQTVMMLWTRRTKSTTTAALQRSKASSQTHPRATSTRPSEISTPSLTSSGQGKTPSWTARTPATKPSASLRLAAQMMITGWGWRLKVQMLRKQSLITRVLESWVWVEKCPVFEFFLHHLRVLPFSPAPLRHHASALNLQPSIPLGMIQGKKQKIAQQSKHRSMSVFFMFGYGSSYQNF